VPRRFGAESELPERALALVRVEKLEQEAAVEVVELVLEAARLELVRLD
jgi:hypothetical protein